MHLSKKDLLILLPLHLLPPDNETAFGISQFLGDLAHDFLNLHSPLLLPGLQLVQFSQAYCFPYFTFERCSICRCRAL